MYRNKQLIRTSCISYSDSLIDLHFMFPIPKKWYLDIQCATSTLSFGIQTDSPDLTHAVDRSC